MRNFLKFFAILIAFRLNLVNGIHYGKTANKHQFPYAVLIHSPRFFCAGALISDRHIITAAHCLMSVRNGTSVPVNVGAHKYYGNKASDGKTIYASKFWIHENFTMPSAVFDIGVIELPEALVSSEKISWLKLSTKLNADLDAEDKEVYLAGWGYTEYSYGVADELRWTKMNLMPLDECMKYKDHYVEDMNKDHICTRKTEGMPCGGDSGSVIVSSKTHKILGIVSYVKDAENGIDMGYNDCDSDIPVASSRISSYIDWISNKTGVDFRAISEKDDRSNSVNPIKNPIKKLPVSTTTKRSSLVNTAKTTTRPNTIQSTTERVTYMIKEVTKPEIINPRNQNNQFIDSFLPSASNNQNINVKSRRR